jgi:deoxycytidylate deaminase
MAYISSRPYPYLPEGKEIKYVPAENPFMLEAMKVCRQDSTESMHSTGAVIVKDGAVIGKGANQASLKSSGLKELHKKFCIRGFFKIPSGQKYWLCPGCAQPSSHAEPRAVKDALKKTPSIVGSDIYLYGHWWCCQPCWDKMTAAGIRDVYLVEGATEMFSR